MARDLDSKELGKEEIWNNFKKQTLLTSDLA